VSTLIFCNVDVFSFILSLESKLEIALLTNQLFLDFHWHGSLELRATAFFESV